MHHHHACTLTSQPARVPNMCLLTGYRYLMGPSGDAGTVAAVRAVANLRAPPGLHVNCTNHVHVLNLQSDS